MSENVLKTNRDHSNQQIKYLTKLRKTLETLINTCQSSDDSVHSPIIVETLVGKHSPVPHKAN